MINKIEVDFAVPVVLSDQQQEALMKFVDFIARTNCPIGQVHWAFGCGAKPSWSKVDAEFLGKEVDPNAPQSGEPTYDTSVFHISTAVKEKLK